MIVDGGTGLLLQSQLSLLDTFLWGLFTSDTVITETTVLTDLTEASWSGYTRSPATGWDAISLQTPRQVAVPTANPSFGNTSGSAQSFHGWFVVDSGGVTLIAAANLGPQTIADGTTLQLAAACSDRDEP